MQGALQTHAYPTKHTQPELLAGKRYCEDVDTYSLGIVMFEVAMRKLPYSKRMSDFKKKGGKGVDSSMMRDISTGLLDLELDGKTCRLHGVSMAYRKRES